jgi:hypothetical protein
MSEAERALARALAEACFGADAGEALARDPRGFLEKHGVAAEDIEASLSSAPRLAVYRSLVRNGLSGVIVRMLPRTRARMNALCADRFDRDFAGYVDEVGPRTHYLRDVPHEFLAWATPRWRRDATVPEYLADLAEHEVTGFAIAAARRDTPDPADGCSVSRVSIDRSIVFADSMRLLHYAWAVHELPDDDEARDAPAHRDVHLLAYRDAEHRVRWLELTPLAARIVEKLQAGEALGVAITHACDEFGTNPSSDAVANLLADLGQRGVLLGAQTAAATEPLV